MIFYNRFLALGSRPLSSNQIYRSDKHQVVLGKSRVGTQSPTHSHPHVYWVFWKPLIYHDHLISKTVKSNPTELKWHHLKSPRCWTDFGWGSTDLKKFPPLCSSASSVINTSALKTTVRTVPCAGQHVVCRALFWGPQLNAAAHWDINRLQTNSESLSYIQCTCWLVGRSTNSFSDVAV